MASSKRIITNPSGGPEFHPGRRTTFNDVELTIGGQRVPYPGGRTDAHMWRREYQGEFVDRPLPGRFDFSVTMNLDSNAQDVMYGLMRKFDEAHREHRKRIGRQGRVLEDTKRMITLLGYHGWSEENVAEDGLRLLDIGLEMKHGVIASFSMSNPENDDWAVMRDWLLERGFPATRCTFGVSDATYPAYFYRNIFFLTVMSVVNEQMPPAFREAFARIVIIELMRVIKG